MRVVGYGRASEQGVEIPLVTQKRGVQQFCEDNGHAFEKWYSDECDGDTPLLERDGFTDMLRWATDEGMDAVVVWHWERLSPDPAITASFEPLTKVCFGEAIPLWDTEGPIRLDKSEVPEHQIVGDAMAQLVQQIESWRRAMDSFRKKESLQKLLENEEHRVGQAPWGLETDKQRFENRDRVFEYYPDDRGESDKFEQAIEILNWFAMENTNPHERDIAPTARDIMREYDITTVDAVKGLWDRRETYREIAEKRRPDLRVRF